jgi:hypothetical protein
MGHSRSECKAPIGIKLESRDCGTCLQHKPISEFPFDPKTGRYSSPCKECDRARRAEIRAANPGPRRASGRKWEKRWRTENREKYLERNRANALRRYYRLKQAGRAPKSKLRDGRGGIYFVQEGGGGPIKIGYSKHSPTLRVQGGQIFNPRPLRIIATMPGTRRDETRLHDRVAHLWVTGEWFAAAPELVAFIQSEATPFPNDRDATATASN